MTGGIHLDKEKGVNPHVTVCWNCGKSVGVALLGSADKLYKCSKCGMHSIGGRQRPCPKCTAPDAYDFERNIDDSETLPIELCDNCRRVFDEVHKGGIHWKCTDCGSAGAIKAWHPLAEAVRAHTKIAAPDPVGVEFDKNDCPLCTGAVKGEGNER